MRVIPSHDVDHITVWEHWKDPILPKYIVRAYLERALGKISWKELALRHGDFITNRWERITEVMDLHERLGIRSCFFFGMANGKGLSYPLRHAEKHVPQVLARGFEAGVHGIAYTDEAAMAEEHRRFAAISGRSDFGIRMHYLRQDDTTFRKLAALGYRFDATSHGVRDPYRLHGIWQFPLLLMDGWAMDGEKRFQSRDLEGAKRYTIAKIEEAERADLRFMSILFHDRYYSPAFATWKAWYEWLLAHLKERGHSFVTHGEAMAELEAGEGSPTPTRP
ncbi:MAG: hypothetical protein J5I62_06830 [Flavobacteriales bacterium]|nr:hypothetical protein [Flavobacteriales bacterium]MEB2341333.1 hypothetical protein [Flavobacteriia bacterium]